MADSFYSSVSQDKFKLPDMGDYYDEDLVEEFMNELSKVDYESPEYYIEEPFSTTLGYHSECEAFVIKAKAQIPSNDNDNHKIGAKNVGLNALDGDTMYFYISSIDDGGNSFNIRNTDYDSFTDYIYANTTYDKFNSDTFILRSVGIDCPEVVHYGLVPYLKSDYEAKKNITTMTIARAKNNGPDIIYDEYINRDDNTLADFLYYNEEKTKLVEIVKKFDYYPFDNNIDYSKIFTELYFGTETNLLEEEIKNEIVWLKVAVSSNLKPNLAKKGIDAKDIYVDLLRQAVDIRIVIDANQIQWLGYATGPFKVDYGVFSLDGMWTYIKSQWIRLFGDGVYKYAGFNSFGQDAYKRFLGTTYVKIKAGKNDKEVWINASKYIKAKLGDAVSLSLGTTPNSVDNNNNLSSAFILWTYDSSRYKYIDAYSKLSSDDIDDRERIQNSITGYDYNLCKEYTVIIGDCLFMIPPTLIREVTQSDSSRVQLLRSKGTMVRQKPNNEKSLQLTLYFNTETGINGYPVKTKLPNGEQRTYYMNGLRSLIAMFKLTPYLPIENEYINNTLNIEAVTLQSIEIQTMKAYPKCLAVNLILQNFNYRTFLTELPIPDPNKGEKFDKNMFATTINYEVMRYYYQEPLKRGEIIKNYGKLSDDYVHMTLGNRTSLIPMQFKSNIMKFYILDENWLNTLLNIKKLSQKQPVKQVSEINKATENWAMNTGLDLAKIFSVIKSYEFPENLNKPTTVKSDRNPAMYDTTTQDCLNDLRSKIFDSNIRNLSSIDFEYKDPRKLVLKFNLNNITTAEFKNLIKTISLELGLDQNKEIEFKNGVLKLALKDEGKKKYINGSTQEYQIAEFFIYRSGKKDDNTDLENVDTEDWGKFTTNVNTKLMSETKDNAIDVDTFLSAKFIEYPLEILPEQITISMQNIFSNTKLKAYDGYAPQYCGGQDTIIEVAFQTRSRETVQTLTTLQSIATNYLIKYRQILNCWPIRVDDELIQLCGVNEVLLESIDTSTVPNFPDLYNITLRLISVDRTMRNKEALNKLDEINNAGAINASGVANVITKTYFELNEVLSKTEIYPDLELPTIEELEQHGFRFIKYSMNKGNRVYPDPDFYFVYAYTYSAQMIRKMIIDYFANLNSLDSDDVTYMFADDNTSQKVYLNLLKSEEQYQVKYAYDSLYNIYNEKIKKIDEEIIALSAEEDKKLKEIANIKKDIEDTYGDIASIESEIISNMSQAWNICPKIKCYIGNSGFNFSQENDAMKKINKTIDELVESIDKYLKKPIEKNKNDQEFDTDNFYNNFIAKCSRYFKTEYINSENNIWEEILTKVGTFIQKDSETSIGIAPGGPGVVYPIYTPGESSISTQVYHDIGALFASAAAALSSSSEYADGLDNSIFEAKGFIDLVTLNHSWAETLYETENVIPYIQIMDENTKEIFIATSEKQGMKNGIAFGPFQIRKYDKDYLNSFYSEYGIFNNMDFIDPYYNKELHYKIFNEQLSDDEYNEYKNCISKNYYYSIEAFNRIVLVWVRRLLKDGVYINYLEYDKKNIINKYNKLLNNIYENITSKVNANKKTSIEVAGDKLMDLGEGLLDMINGDDDNDSKIEIDVNDEQLGLEDLADALNTYTKRLKELLSENDNNTILGKVFLGVVCAVTHGDPYIYGDIIGYDISSLNAKVGSTVTEIDLDSNVQQGERYFRKFIRIMCYKMINLIDNFSKISVVTNSELEDALNESVEKLWVSAANDPSLWIMHSFYDMVTHNKRGRMARAFPTYYMLLIDEGREIGYWKLHDNFYNINAITEMQITKSRKIPADTAKITMTNLYKTYTTNDEDIRTDYENNLTDAFDSIFNPHKYFEKAETKRSQQLNVNKVKLKPGVRIHIRMGYSGDASDLPIVFNGVIAEVSTGELIEIVAQGDGAELANPDVFTSLSAEDLSQVSNEDDIKLLQWIENFFDDGKTPKELIKNLLTTKSAGFTKTIINWMSDGRFFNDNAFGIVNFGEIDYKELHKNGEVMQNIYEAEGGLPWTQSADPGTTAYYHNEILPPVFTVELRDKSVWDILNVCASSSIDYIVGIAPFGVRSTIFFGRPHYYYAYDYYKDSNGKITEKRKPYSQYHIVSSYNDIIGNNITASSSQLKTCAVGIYEGPNIVNKKVSKKLEQMWIDFDIYPEFQKTVTVDTGMVYKGSKFGFIFFNWAHDVWALDGGQKLAWKMTARALKDSVKDMYQGELVILGDPCIKPYDRVYLQDVYEDMNGSFEVEAVVLNMSVENGFTTSIYPDCISTIDNRYEQIGQVVSANIIGQVLLSQGALYTANQLFNTNTKPFLGTISKIVKKGATVSVDTINKISNLITEEDLIKYSKLEDWTNAFYRTIGISEEQVKLYDMINYLTKYNDYIKKVDVSKLNNFDDVYAVFKNIVNTDSKINLDDISKGLAALKNENIDSSYISDIDNLIKTIGDNSGNMSLDNLVRNTSTSILSSLGENPNLTAEELKSVTEINKYLAKDTISIDDSKAIIKELDNIIGKTDDLYENKALVDSIVSYNDEFCDTIKIISEATNKSKITNAIFSMSFLKSAGSAILTFGIEFIIQYCLTKSVYNWIENKLASFNVLQIYPLKKNGVVYIAGLDGHKGLVVGSPSYNKQGLIDQFVNWVFKDRGPVYNFFKNLIMSDNMKNIVETYYKDNKYGEYSGATGEAEYTLNDMLASIAEKQMTTYSAYKSIALCKRTSNLKTDEASITYFKTHIDLTTDITTNSLILNELIPITRENELLREYFNNGTLKTAHNLNYKLKDETKELNKTSYTFDTKQAGKVKTYGINIGTKKEPLIDIPFLRVDAFQVLLKILTDIQVSEQSQAPGNQKNPTLYFLSGVIAGANKWNSTGYIFKIFVSNYDNLESELNKIKTELESSYVGDSEDIKEGLIQFKKYDDTGNYEIFVAPRVTSAY